MKKNLSKNIWLILGTVFIVILTYYRIEEFDSVSNPLITIGIFHLAIYLLSNYSSNAVGKFLNHTSMILAAGMIPVILGFGFDLDGDILVTSGLIFILNFIYHRNHLRIDRMDTEELDRYKNLSANEKKRLNRVIEINKLL